MSTLVPRPPYTDAELRKLYPAGLELQQVQILMRHGERTPVSARFRNAGLAPFWPYCSVVRRMKSSVMQSANSDAPWTYLDWQRRLESFATRTDEPVAAVGPHGEVDSMCDMGMLTDTGRRTAYSLGLRLRALYIDRLKFMPPCLSSADSVYLRATPIPRALESLQEAFTALYPPSQRIPNHHTGQLPVLTILTRASGDETLFPNDNCRRFAALARAFAQRAAERWNETDEMGYLSKLWGKWMPEDSPKVAVDSQPRLSGIMDTVNSTLAHGPETRLPSEFYDKKAIRVMERIGMEEWFAGYQESREYRALGVGALMGDIVGRMVGSVQHTAADGEYEAAKKMPAAPPGVSIKLGMSGCHDTTLGAILASLGAKIDEWPPYTSHLAIEMFRKPGLMCDTAAAAPSQQLWRASLLSSAAVAGRPSSGLGRKPLSEWTQAERDRLKGHYVRIRYNDEPVTIPACRLPGNHLEDDESFCTLTAFKEIVDKFTPKHWKEECRANLNKPALPAEPEWAGR